MQNIEYKKYNMETQHESVITNKLHNHATIMYYSIIRVYLNYNVYVCISISYTQICLFSYEIVYGHSPSSIIHHNSSSQICVDKKRHLKIAICVYIVFFNLDTFNAGNIVLYRLIIQKNALIYHCKHICIKSINILFVTPTRAIYKMLLLRNGRSLENSYEEYRNINGIMIKFVFRNNPIVSICKDRSLHMLTVY